MDVKPVRALSLLAAALALPSASLAAPPRARAPQPEASEDAPEAAPELVHLEASGITAEQVGKKAGATSFKAKAMEASLREAAAHVDEAWTGFLPKFNVTARYTRLSKFTQAKLFKADDGFNPVFSNQPPYVPGTQAEALDPSRAVVARADDYRLQVIPDHGMLQFTVVVPVSDMLLRVTQMYAAASHAEDAARYEARLAHAKASVEGKIAYYTWLRAKGALTVANLALRDQQNHLKDQRSLQSTGGAARGDLLRAEGSVAAAELAVERAGDLAALSERQVRLAMHVGAEERLVPAEGFEVRTVSLPPLADVVRDGLAERLELKSLEASSKALRAQARGARFGALPQIGAFGEVMHANPNPRTIPPRQEWLPTWAAGVQVSWSPNEALGGVYGGASVAARADAVEAERAAAREVIELEIMQAYHEVKQSTALVESSKRDLASAEETYRAARQLFSTGRLPAATLTDTETDLTRARLGALNAAVDARIAKVRLEHAQGLDVKR